MTPKEAAAALRALAQSLPRVVDAAVEKSLETDRQRARGRIHSVTGRLAGSLRVTRTSDGFALEAGGPSAPHAPIIQGGAAPHQIVPSKAPVLAFVSAGVLRFARHVEHPGLRARPFLEINEPALNQAAEKAVDQAAAPLR